MGLLLRRSALASCAMVLTAVGLVAASAPTTEPAPPAATKPATKRSTSAAAATQPTHKVTRGSISLVLRSLGTLEPVDPFELRLRPEAYKGEMKIVTVVPNGATVKAGDVLLQIDATDITRDLAGAENDLTTAKANLEKAKADVQLAESGDALALRIQKTALAQAEAALKWWEQVDGPALLKRAEINVFQSKASVEDQDDELDQLRKMYKDEELTSATADIVVKRAVRSLDISKQYLSLSEQSAAKTREHEYAVSKQKVVDAVDQAKQQLAQLEVTQKHAAIVRTTGIRSAELAAAAAEKKAKELKADLAAMTVKAPFDGRVVYGALTEGAWQGPDAKALRAGEKVAAGTTLMTLSAPGKLRVVLDVPEAKLAWLTPGMKATITPVAWPELKLIGRCAAPAPTGKGGADQAFKLPIDLESPPDARLSAGMKANVRIDAGTVENVLVLPVAAVSGGVVKVQGKDGKPQEKDVTVGRSDGTVIEIRDGLSEGDEVLAAAGQPK